MRKKTLSNILTLAQNGHHTYNCGMPTNLGSLFITIFLSTSSAFGLSRFLSCEQVEMSPEEIVIEVKGKDFDLLKDLVIHMRNVEVQRPRIFQVMESVQSESSALKAVYSNSDVSLMVSKQETRSYDGDVGLGAQLLVKTNQPKNMVCWYFKRAKSAR